MSGAMASGRAAWWAPRLSEEQRRALVAGLTDEDAARLVLAERYSDAWLRPDQRPPAGSWRVWLLLGGRGAGKNFASSHFVVSKAKEPGARIALVARSAADVRDTVVLGPSGILAVSPPWFYPVYKPSLRRLEWPNGSIAITYSAAEPALLRGPGHTAAAADEVGYWGKEGKEAWSNLEFGLRMGPHPQVVATTSPETTDLVLDLARGPKGPDGKRVPRSDTIVTHSSMVLNMANLAADFVRAAMLKASSARGRSEVHGELLDFSEDALWDAETLAACRCSDGFVMSPEIVVVGFDPSHSPDGTGDACGIVGAALKSNGVAVVVQDDSTQGKTPVQNWLQAFETAEDIGATEIVFEDNPSPTVAPSFVRDTLNLALKERRAPAGVKLIPTHAAKSKELRARPIAAAYREGRVQHHTDADLGDLEAEMATWVPGKSPSPNRLDAAVIALARLLLGDRKRPLVLTS